MTLLKMGFMALLLSSGVAHAINPIHNWYAGFIVGGSNSSDLDFNIITPIDFLEGQGSITYTLLGKVGGHVGYRFNQFRVEGELFYNNNAYKHMEVDGLNIPNINTPVTTSIIPPDEPPNPYKFKGYTNTYALMLNGFYDFYIPDYTEHVVPYVGLGIGYEHVENNLTFFYNGSITNNSVFSEFTNDFAGQGIVGLSYFVTDHTSFAFDFRYFSALRGQYTGTDLTFHSYPQLYSVNFVFNSAFDLG